MMLMEAMKEGREDNCGKPCMLRCCTVAVWVLEFNFQTNLLINQLVKDSSFAILANLVEKNKF